MSDPIVGNGVSNGKGDDVGQLHLEHAVVQTRDELLARLRSNLGWVSAQDHNVAIDLDSIIHALETLAYQEVQKKLEIVTKERDSARADLFRIYKIVRNPMVLLEEEFAVIRTAMERPIESNNIDVKIISKDDTQPDSPPSV